MESGTNTSGPRGGGAVGWETNCSVSEIAAVLRGSSRVLVFTHMKPDGDAAGSSIGLANALNGLAGHRAEVVFGGPRPGWVSWLAESNGGTPVRLWEKGGPGGGVPEWEPDAIVVVDTGSWSQLELFEKYLRPRAERTIVIDHHRRGDAEVAARRWVDSGAAAACQLVAGLACLLLRVTPEALPLEVARPLYLGLATDTGWFRHTNVDAGVLRLASELVETGVVPNELFQRVEQQDTVGRMRLMSRALGSLRLHDTGLGRESVAVMQLTRRDFAETGATASDTGGLIDVAQMIGSVRVSALLNEADGADFGKPGSVMTKISLRSKTDDVDVDRVCRGFGGGGHVRAAGAKVEMGLEAATAAVVRALGG